MFLHDPDGAGLVYTNESVAQSNRELALESQGSARWSVVNDWMGDRYVLGLAHALRLLQSQILCRLFKCPLDEYKSRPAACIHLQKDDVYA